MRYFFNDVEVTETEYKDLISKSTPDVPAKFVQVVPNVKVEPVNKACDIGIYFELPRQMKSMNIINTKIDVRMFCVFRVVI